GEVAEVGAAVFVVKPCAAGDVEFVPEGERALGINPDAVGVDLGILETVERNRQSACQRRGFDLIVYELMIVGGEEERAGEIGKLDVIVDDDRMAGRGKQAKLLDVIALMLIVVSLSAVEDCFIQVRQFPFTPV